MKRPLIVVAVVLAIASLAAGHRARRAHRMTSAESCGGCHADVAPSDHTREFVRTEHGERAREGRARCLACHRDNRADCERCHRAQSPEWHTKAVRDPRASVRARIEHRKAAQEHGRACAECHRQVFQLQCAECHRADERWLRAGHAEASR